MIDTVASFPELTHLENKQSRHVTEQSEIAWLSRYPRELRLLLDPGAKSRELRRHCIKLVPTSTKNPHANAIYTRMHHSAPPHGKYASYHSTYSTDCDTTEESFQPCQGGSPGASRAVNTGLRNGMVSVAFEDQDGPQGLRQVYIPVNVAYISMLSTAASA